MGSTSDFYNSPRSRSIPIDSSEKTESEHDKSSLKEQIHQCLKIIGENSSGSFATAGTLPHPENPGSTVYGLGTIGLPLSDRDAIALSKRCHQAPFGKGSETFIDKSVRNTWELSPDQFELRNPAWQFTLDQATQQVANALGVVGGSLSMRADLYKLLLYDEGAFFESHTDTEKAPGMFGTLVIVLPSQHTGGDVLASFGGQTLTLESAESWEFGFSYLAWYSDVEHTVRPVTSGHRLVLTYNLVHVAFSPPNLPSSFANDRAELSQILRIWNDNLAQKHADAPVFLAYMLDHKYTEANLRLTHLEGRDAFRAERLQAACQDQDFCFFLGNLEFRKDGSCEDFYSEYDHYRGRGGWKTTEATSDSGLAEYHMLQDVFDTSLDIRTLHRANGQQLATGTAIQTSDIVQRKSFDRAPDKESYQGFTGNEGASATHTYRNSCIIMLPKQYQTKFFLERALNGNVDMEAWVGTAIEEFVTTPEDNHLRAELVKTCRAILEVYKSVQERNRPWQYQRLGSGLGESALHVVMKAALELEVPSLFESATLLVKDDLPLEIYGAVGRTLGMVDIEPWEQGLNLALSLINSVHQRWKAATEILRAHNEYTQSSSPLSSNRLILESRRQNTIESILADPVSVVKEDGETLIEIIQKYGQGFLFKKILPFVKERASSTSFCMTFLVSLLKAENNNEIKDGIAKNIYQDVLADLIPAFNLEVDLPLPKRTTQFQRRNGRERSEQSKPSLMDGNEIATLINNCRSLDLFEEIEALMSHVIESSRTVEASAFDTLIMPTLTRLIELSQLSGVSLKEPSLRFFVQNLLDTYIQRYVGNEPARPKDWARARRGCGCRDCQDLDNYLIDPKKQIGRFALAKKRRAHLQNKLESLGFTHETDYQGCSQTLVVTKNSLGWQSDLKVWRERCSVAQQTLQRFGTSNLQELLGERYNEIINLEAVKLNPARGDSSKPGRTTSSVAGARPPRPSARPGQRTSLRTASQPNSRANNLGAIVDKQAAPPSTIEVVDLTAE